MNIARRSTLIIILIAVLAAVCAGVLWFNHSGKEPLVTVVHRPEVVMNVFIHGTFGTLLGLFSLYPIVKDEIKGTLYNKVLRKMRKNPFFFKEQPIFSRGMHKINPTFDLSETGSHKYGAYPIIKAFDEVSEAISPGKYKNDYYTFGWTGFMSKTRRRAESIRLYNALNEAIAEYASQGIKPKIRILAHSHGGNLALQLAGVNELLLEGEAQALERYADDAERAKTIGL
jgi:hypothetical protein